MNKLFKKLKKYIWIIIIIVIIGINSYNVIENKKIIDKINIKISILTDKELNNKKVITVLENNSLNIFMISKMQKKPSYNYLKSVTVFIRGVVWTTIVAGENKHKTEYSYWCGTGVIVKIDKNNTFILTNRHVAGNFMSKNQFFLSVLDDKNNIYHHASIVKRCDYQDLAIIKITGHLKGKSVINGLNMPIISEKIYTVGHSLTRPFMYSEGVFSGTTIDYDVYQVSTTGGQSGSGIFNKNGELIGIIKGVAGYRNSFIMQWDNTRGIAIKAVYINKFLKENL